MERNVGRSDRLRRIAAGVLFLLVGLAMLLESMVGLVPLVLAGFMFGTGVARWCPVHAVLSDDTLAGR